MRKFIRLILYCSLALAAYPLFIAIEYLFLYIFSNTNDPLRNELLAGYTIGIVYALIPALIAIWIGFYYRFELKRIEKLLSKIPIIVILLSYMFGLVFMMLKS
jgi:uncharacterized protein YacL